MTKTKQFKKRTGISPERLADLRRATLIASAGASTRIEGSKLSDKEVEQLANIFLGKSRNFKEFWLFLVHSPQFSYNSIKIAVAKSSYRFKVAPIITAKIIFSKGF